MTLDEQIRQLLKEEISAGGTLYQEVLKPMIDAAVKPLHDELARIKEIGEPVYEYMPISYFLREYKISKKTEIKVRKTNPVGCKKKFRFKTFHVEQWRTAYSMYTAKKPIF